MILSCQWSSTAQQTHNLRTHFKIRTVSVSQWSVRSGGGDHRLKPDGGTRRLHRPSVISSGAASQVTTSTGGVKDSAHLGPLTNQFVVFSNGLLRLQDSDVHTSLLHKVQSGGGNLRRDAHTLNTAAWLKRVWCVSVNKENVSSFTPCDSAEWVPSAGRGTDSESQLQLSQAAAAEEWSWTEISSKHSEVIKPEFISNVQQETVKTWRILSRVWWIC